MTKLNNNINQINNTVTAMEAISDIRKHIDYTQPLQLDALNDITADDKQMNNYIDYVSTKSYRKSHYKSANSYRFDQTYFNQQLEQIADYILRDYDTENGLYADNTLLTNYAIKKDEYRLVAIDTDAESDSIEKGLAIHIDLLDSLHVDDNLQLSDRFRRNNRHDNIKANIDKYSDLKQMYNTWEQMGYNYGLHSAYTRDEKETIREYWLNKFELEDNEYSPANRMWLINQSYNQLGYDMHLAYEGLRNPIHSSQTRDNVNVTYDGDDTLDLLLDTLDLTEVNHMESILDIQKSSKKARVIGIVEHVNDYFPLLNMLEVKYESSELAGGIGTVLYELFSAVKVADLEDYQIELFEMIRRSDEYINELDGNMISLMLDNPYLMMIKQLEDKHEIELDMRQLRAEINKLAKVLSDTYNDMQMGMEGKTCVNCEVEKMPSAYTNDNRAADGKYSSCKKCVTNSVNKVKKVS